MTVDDFPCKYAETASDPYHHSAEDERIFSMGMPLALGIGSRGLACGLYVLVAFRNEAMSLSLYRRREARFVKKIRFGLWSFLIPGCAANSMGECTSHFVGILKHLTHNTAVQDDKESREVGV